MRTCSCRLALLVVATLAVAAPAEDSAANPASTTPPTRLEDLTCADGRAADTADSVRSELDSLRRRVVDRVRLPRSADRMLRHYLGDD